MRDTQARRRRRIVGPTWADRARGVGDDPARLPRDPDQVDVCGWENEGGARRSDRGGGPLEAPRLARQG